MNRAELAALLQQQNQTHILAYYDKLSAKEQINLTEQIAKVDFNLIAKALNSNKIQAHGQFEPLAGISVKQIDANKEQFHEIGLQTLREGKVAAVLLAGGQGTRLGCDGPKGIVNIGLTKELYIFEMHFKEVMAVAERANAWIPFYIMTSDKNHDQTVSFLREHHYFGYPEEYVTFYIQDMNPSVDYEGKLLMEAPSSLSLSPNGNGGWFSSMVKAGLLKDLHQRGIEWLNVFAVDNVLQKIADPTFIGATIAANSTSGAKVVRKANPNERVGVLCLEDGKPCIVEYYEMTNEMIHRRNEDGELSYAFGVILNYLFRMDQLEKILHLELPVHVVEKKIPYVTPDGQYVEPDKTNGYKFEELVLDMIHLLDNCLPFEVVREDEFAPIKNAIGEDSIDTARQLLKHKGIIL